MAPAWLRGPPPSWQHSQKASELTPSGTDRRIRCCYRTQTPILATVLLRPSSICQRRSPPRFTYCTSESGSATRPVGVGFSRPHRKLST